MRPEEQRSSQPRYTVTPRTLVFLTREEEILLLRGAPHKRLWAGKVNGLGGHVEPGEDIATAARREVEEEAGIEIEALTLRAVITITLPEPPGVLLFVFAGTAARREPLRPSSEGELFWSSRENLSRLPLMEDLPELLPRVLGPGPISYGHYQFTPTGLQITWTS
jgi:8-oxo-dGTP diphosphatase